MPAAKHSAGSPPDPTPAKKTPTEPMAGVQKGTETHKATLNAGTSSASASAQPAAPAKPKEIDPFDYTPTVRYSKSKIVQNIYCPCKQCAVKDDFVRYETYVQHWMEKDQRRPITAISFEKLLFTDAPDRASTIMQVCYGGALKMPRMYQLKEKMAQLLKNNQKQKDNHHRQLSRCERILNTERLSELNASELRSQIENLRSINVELPILTEEECNEKRTKIEANIGKRNTSKVDQPARTTRSSATNAKGKENQNQKSSTSAGTGSKTTTTKKPTKEPTKSKPKPERDMRTFPFAEATIPFDECFLRPGMHPYADDSEYESSSDEDDDYSCDGYGNSLRSHVDEDAAEELVDLFFEDVVDHKDASAPINEYYQWVQDFVEEAMISKKMFEPFVRCLEERLDGKGISESYTFPNSLGELKGAIKKLRRFDQYGF